ncbi:MAG: glycosyltransferase family 4 protein [Bacteroidales bacterium]
MKIAIEAQRIFRPNKHGMDFVVLESIRQLQQIDHENEYFIIVAPGADVCLTETPNFHIIILKSSGGYPVWEQIALPRLINNLKPDLLHCTSNTAPVNISVPLIITLHDIIFLEKQQTVNASFYQRLGRIYRKIIVPVILGKCKKIITVSNFEKERIANYLNLDRDKLIAIYNGFSDHFHQISRDECLSITKKYINADKYIFFLGNTDPKKNTINTLKAYAQYVEQSADPAKLLIADLNDELLKRYLIENNLTSIESMVICPGYISNKDLPFIYSAADTFLYTSLRESFGIPLLEAMACGTPVITSDRSALPEIAGSGAILADPTNSSDIAAYLLKLETNPDFRLKTIQYGLERVKLFSWRNTAVELLKLYTNIILQDGNKK